MYLLINTRASARVPYLKSRLNSSFCVRHYCSLWTVEGFLPTGPGIGAGTSLKSTISKYSHANESNERGAIEYFHVTIRTCTRAYLRILERARFRAF